MNGWMDFVHGQSQFDERAERRDREAEERRQLREARSETTDRRTRRLIASGIMFVVLLALVAVWTF